MFYGVTIDVIFNRMVDAYRHEFDRREGSIQWDEFMNVAIELKAAYDGMEFMWKNSFGDTAEWGSLVRLAAERGIYPLPPTHAIIEVEFNVPIEITERFNYDGINYQVQELIGQFSGNYRYKLMCETPGTEGNLTIGTITPIENVQGLTKAEIIKLLVPGEDQEDLESFRSRYFYEITKNDYGFNRSEYIYQTNLIPGVGAVRCYPAIPEPGHVTLVLLDSEYGVPTQALIDEIQERIDPVPYQQEGEGIAPIGHYVHVKGADAVPINISAKITTNPKITYLAVEDRIKDVLEEYLLELRELFERNYDIGNPEIEAVVRETYVESKILDIGPEYIMDVKVNTINGSPGNFTLPKDSVPVLGVITND